MRWYVPRDGDLRKKKRFLLLPKHINREWRWLEVAEWEDVYVWEKGNPGTKGFGTWEPSRWVLGPEEEERIEELRKEARERISGMRKMFMPPPSSTPRPEPIKRKP